MANYRTFLNITLLDAQGNIARQRIDLGLLPDSDTVAGLATDMAGYITALGAPGVVTNAKVLEQSVTVLLSKSQAGGSGPALDAEFTSVADAARLQFANSAGDRASLSIPAPIPTVFGTLPLENVVDPAGAAAPVIAWMIAHAGGPALLNLYEGGVKISRRAPVRAQRRVV